MWLWISKLNCLFSTYFFRNSLYLLYCLITDFSKFSAAYCQLSLVLLFLVAYKYQLKLFKTAASNPLWLQIVTSGKFCAGGPRWYYSFGWKGEIYPKCFHAKVDTASNSMCPRELPIKTVKKKWNIILVYPLKIMSVILSTRRVPILRWGQAGRRLLPSWRKDQGKRRATHSLRMDQIGWTWSGRRQGQVCHPTNHAPAHPIPPGYGNGEAVLFLLILWDCNFAPFIHSSNYWCQVFVIANYIHWKNSS